MEQMVLKNVLSRTFTWIVHGDGNFMDITFHQIVMKASLPFVWNISTIMSSWVYISWTAYVMDMRYQLFTKKKTNISFPQFANYL